ncbi:MAG: complex I subunit 4 family protein [Bacteroidia bacterium]
MGLENFLPVTISLPLLGALFISLLPTYARFFQKLFTTLLMAATAYMLWDYFMHAAIDLAQPQNAFYKFQLSWLGVHTPLGWSARYDTKILLGLDGISVFLFALTNLICWILAFWEVPIAQKNFYAGALLFLQSGLLLTFSALDAIVFYVGFEMVLLPMYGLLLLGSSPDKARFTALSFIFYTLVGSVLMLGGILGMGVLSGQALGLNFTTDYFRWQQYIPDAQKQYLLYATLGLAFAIKLGIFPLHGWVIPLYRHAPLPIVVLSTALLMKLGGYGWLRWGMLFPHGHFAAAPYIGALSAAGIVYGALLALRATTLRDWLGYSTLSHVGFIGLGIATLSPMGLLGSVWQMVTHGLSATAMLLLTSRLVAQNAQLVDLGGMATRAPLWSFAFAITALANIGLPGLSNFIPEFLILWGSYQTYAFKTSVFVIALLGVILSAGYTLPVMRQILFSNQGQAAPDLSAAQWTWIGIFLVAVVFLGWGAAPFLEEIGRSTFPLAQTFRWILLGL